MTDPLTWALKSALAFAASRAAITSAQERAILARWERAEPGNECHHSPTGFHIVGGESGPNARPMNLDWARSLKRQSDELGRVFNFKQVGSRKADKGGHLLDGREYLNRPNPTGADQ